MKIRAIRGQNSNEASEFGLNRQVCQAYMEKGASSPFAQAKRTEFPESSVKGLEAPFSIGRIFTAKTPSKKSEEFKKQFLLGELLFLGGSKNLPPNPSPVVLRIENLG